MNRMQAEAVVLTGGKSERMKQSKSEILLEGLTMSRYIAGELSKVVSRVTVLGREPIEGFEFLADAQDYRGPLSALAAFQPRMEWVFVASCDMPLFQAETASTLLMFAKDSAVVPEVAGSLQPLCAVYPAKEFVTARQLMQEGKKSMMAWLDAISYRRVTESDLSSQGVDIESVLGANTPEELDRLLQIKQAKGRSKSQGPES